MSEAQKESYENVKPYIHNQDKLVYDCIKSGYNHSYPITVFLNSILTYSIPETSVRRSLNTLEFKSKCIKRIKNGKVYVPETRGWQTTYEITSQYIPNPITTNNESKSVKPLIIQSSIF